MMARVMVQTVKVTTTGSNGSATGNSDTANVVAGRILKLVIDYHASAPASTDITIATKSGTQPIQETIYTKTDSATDAIVYPRVTVCNNAGTAAVAGDNLWDNYVVSCLINVALAGSNALTNAVIVDIYYEGE
jgi:hypothetical protein